MVRVLVVEDETNIRDMIALNLRHAGMEVVEAESAEAALPLLAQKPGCDAAILDVMLPGMNGFSLCETIRRTDQQIGIIILSAKGQEQDKIRGLSIGADDYMTKPFMPGELIARIKAHLRRQNSLARKAAEAEASLYEYDGLKIDFDTHDLFLDGEPVSLTSKEFEILKLLIQHPRKVFPAAQIFETVWKTTCMENDTKTVMVYISTLRKKLERKNHDTNYIVSVRGVGYKFNQMPKKDE